ncbi:MAG TPA: DUF2459 domain-containing protein [Tepidisphaeraceae bacterium]|nr:DUF2459 domain-containing protein [Tepidisphaeraceae bacterium]
MPRTPTTLLALAALLLIVGGCGHPTLVPPVTTGPTLPVHVADYGYHSSLILPRQSGGLIEYAYGDWQYFAHNKKSVGAAFEALLGSKQATLGRRVLARPPVQAGLKEATGAVSVLRFDAPRDKVQRLERELDQRFATRLESIMWSYAQQLYFVMDSERYSVVNNCNDLTARWLEQLGCEVHNKGLITGSAFVLRPARQLTPVPFTDEPKPSEVVDGAK